MLWVGEAPGKDEVRIGKPFVGASGWVARRTLRWAGFDDERDVRWANTIPFNPGKFPVSARGARLLKEHADALDSVILEMPNLKVVVACGGPAQARLTGRLAQDPHNKKWSWGIEKYHSFVFHRPNIPDVLKWGKEKHRTVLGDGVVVIPCLHPAGILRSKGRDELVNFRRAVQKVRQAVDGTLRKLEFETRTYPPVEDLRAAFEGAATVYFDTEFDRNTKQVYWCGLTADGHTIYGCPWDMEYFPVIKEILERSGVVKGAHNIVADFEALGASGVNLARPWYDTMVAYHALHPALGVGLDDATRYYLDDVAPWKDMDKGDPAYNAMDVAYGWAVMKGVAREAEGREVDPLHEVRARNQLVPVTAGMTRRGMLVDRGVQKQLRDNADSRARKLRYNVYLKAREMWDKRVRVAERGVLKVEAQIAKLREPIGCPKHPTYHGLRKAAAACERCTQAYRESDDKRVVYKELMAKRSALKDSAKRWAGGFNANNNEHLRWLLYDPDGLKLPVQRAGGTRKPTANRLAVDKLASSAYVQRFPAKFAIVKEIKDAQHLRKARATFIDVPLDEEGIAHPPYKVHGTRTGRLAGGSDADEKADNRYAFNPLNVPREWRRMYVAAPGHCFVAADWRNVEGRLTARFCGDSNYREVLARELTGGPKVHAVNASIIYGIDPADAHAHRVLLGGQEREAYYGGKRLTHAWSYGMKPPHMARTFNITLEEAVRIDAALSSAYPRLVEWRRRLVEDVLGVWESVPGTREMRCVREGRRYLANPFGWQLHFLGIEGSQANEVIAFLPQSTGAGLWTRVAPLLADRYAIFTGTYDSFVLSVPVEEVHEAKLFLRNVMEIKWEELGGASFPCEVSVGTNWGEYDEQTNPRGLRKEGD